MEPFMSLVIPFISLIFLVGLCESFIQFVLEELIHIGEKKEQVIGYILTGAFAYFISVFGDYRFLNYLDVYFTPGWLDWVFSALIIAAGSSFLEKKFDFMNLIPGVINGVSAGLQRRKNDAKPKPEIPYVDPNYVDPNHNEPTI